MSFTPSSAGTASRFNVTATPQIYGKTGKRSFYQDESGEVRGGDKNGGLPTVNDPIIETCLSTEPCAIQALRTPTGLIDFQRNGKGIMARCPIGRSG